MCSVAYSCEIEGLLKYTSIVLIPWYSLIYDTISPLSFLGFLQETLLFLLRKKIFFLTFFFFYAKFPNNYRMDFNMVFAMSQRTFGNRYPAILEFLSLTRNDLFLTLKILKGHCAKIYVLSNFIFSHKMHYMNIYQTLPITFFR